MPRPATVTWPRASWWQRMCRHGVYQHLQNVSDGELSVSDGDGDYRFGVAAEGGLRGTIAVRHPRLYSHVVCGGSLAAAESYLRGDWDSDDLTATLRVLARNASALSGCPALTQISAIAR